VWEGGRGKSAAVFAFLGAESGANGWVACLPGTSVLGEKAAARWFSRIRGDLVSRNQGNNRRNDVLHGNIPLICAIKNDCADLVSLIAIIRFLFFQETTGFIHVFPFVAMLGILGEKPTNEEYPCIGSAVSHVLFAKLVLECRPACPIPASFHLDAKTQSRIRGF
jgi:hypothetical protein